MASNLTSEWFGALSAAVSADAEIAAITRYNDFSFLINCGTERALFRFRDGTMERIESIDINRSWDFELAASEATWAQFLSAEPPRNHHDLFAMNARLDDFWIGGSRVLLMQNIRVVLRILEVGREMLVGHSSSATERRYAGGGPVYDNIVGRYITFPFQGRDYRIYFEEAGQGVPLLLLHTAGADSRQYMHMMNDPAYTDRWRLIAFDLPGHGRSFPPDGWWREEYRLTTDFYAEFIMAFARAAGLESPVVMGCSMGGEIVLELAYRFPDELRAVIGCEAADRVEGRVVEWTHHPSINETEAAPSWINGLSSPLSPERHRREIWWTYSQQGPGVFNGDINFYGRDWDGRERVGQIDTIRCPVYLLTGEYDFSCTPEASERTAEKIPGAKFKMMKGLGHFPMAEDPENFKGYMLPVLDEIQDT